MLIGGRCQEVTVPQQVTVGPVVAVLMVPMAVPVAQAARVVRVV